MLSDIDNSCLEANIMYDAFFSAHAHNYQRFTRARKIGGVTTNIPFIVAGTGGRGITNISDADGSTTRDYSYDKSYRGYGYLNVIASATTLKINFIQVDVKTGTKKVFDKISVKL
jgi:hypothetical protein